MWDSWWPNEWETREELVSPMINSQFFSLDKVVGADLYFEALLLWTAQLGHNPSLQDGGSICPTFAHIPTSNPIKFTPHRQLAILCRYRYGKFLLVKTEFMSYSLHVSNFVQTAG